MESFSTALEFAYRRPRVDVVTSLDWSALNLHDGNYLAKGRPAELDTHYVQFGSFGQFSFLSLDVAIIGHYPVRRWFELRYGGGFGLGLLLGDVRLTNNSTNCTIANAGSPDSCHPVSPTIGPIVPGSAGFEDKLRATEDATAVDTAQNPHRHVTSDKPPVMVVINAVLGIRFYPTAKWAIDIDGGFRNAFFLGLSLHRLF